MKTKLFVILAACSLLLTIPAQAQDDSTSSRRRRPVEALKRILELTDTQVQQFSELRQTHRLATETQRTQIREWTSQIRNLQQQKNELLNSTNPDAGQVGSFVIEQRRLQALVRQARQDLATSFHNAALEILDTTQQEKVAQIQQALTLAPQARPLAAFGLIQRPRPQRSFRRFRRPRTQGTEGPQLLQESPGFFLPEAQLRGRVLL